MSCIANVAQGVCSLDIGSVHIRIFDSTTAMCMLETLLRCQQSGFAKQVLTLDSLLPAGPTKCNSTDPASSANLDARSSLSRSVPVSRSDTASKSSTVISEDTAGIKLFPEDLEPDEARCVRGATQNDSSSGTANLDDKCKCNKSKRARSARIDAATQSIAFQVAARQIDPDLRLFPVTQHEECARNTDFESNSTEDLQVDAHASPKSLKRGITSPITLSNRFDALASPRSSTGSESSSSEMEQCPDCSLPLQFWCSHCKATFGYEA